MNHVHRPTADRRRARLRIQVRRLHLWLGLSLGLLFALIGLTGSALVFYTDIDAGLHPAVRGTSPGIASPAWDRALATGRARWPDPGGRWSFEIGGEGGMLPARRYPAAGHHGERMMVWFSADGSRVIRAERWGGYAMSWIYRLHMELLAGEVGLQLVGWSGVVMLVLLGTGLATWWPRGAWRKAIAFKRDAAAIRRLRDLHKLSGLWSIALLPLLAATGVLLALPAVTRALIAPAAIPAPRSAATGAPPIGIVRALALAQAALPDGRIVFVDMPDAADAPVRVRMQVPGDPHARFPGSYVFLDRQSGRVLAVHDLRRAGARAAVASWVRPLHDGSVAGLATRILALLLGLVPAVLFVTGLLHWLRRTRARSAA